jgi:4-hydroxybenzoyl-CoA thioesterase
MASYSFEQEVMFRHCDPAKIVFYPRYFEMINSVIETWFAREAGYPYVTMFNEAKTGVPTAHIETKFHAPSWLGDKLNWQLDVTNLGRSSITFELVCSCGDETRVTANTTLVHVNGETARPSSWPDAVRTQIQNFMERP